MVHGGEAKLHHGLECAHIRATLPDGRMVCFVDTTNWPSFFPKVLRSMSSAAGILYYSK